jgi:Na+/H+ antiporter NhaD/arsenite permease-like protein
VKILYLILSVFVIMLSAKPCCADSDCRATLSAKKELAEKVPAKEKECPGCSPFFTCGTCVGFVISQPLSIQLPIVAVDDVEYCNVYQHPNIEKVALSIWQPPKLS